MVFINCNLYLSNGNSTCLNSKSNFAEGACNTQCPSNPTRYTASSSLDAYWLSIYPRALFTPHCCKQFFIDCDCSFKKWVILVVFEQRIADRNVVHQPLNCDSSKHHSNSHIQVFSKTIKCSYEIWGLSLRCLNLCGLDCF